MSTWKSSRDSDGPMARGIAVLERQGVTKVFQPGASLESIVATVREAASQAA